MTKLKVGLNLKQTTTQKALAIREEHTENLNLHKWDCPHKSKRQVCFDENSYFCGWQMSHKHVMISDKLHSDFL